AAEKAADRQTVLLCATPDGGRLAVPLAQVARLEEFPRSALERVGTQDVVQYRDEILPLIRVGRVLGGRGKRKANAAPPAEAGDTVPDVVYAGRGRRVGLVVGRILDIVEEELTSRSRGNRPGVLFTAVVQETVTEFLDVEGIIRSADPTFFDEQVRP